MLETIRRIERTAYPQHMRQMQNIFTWEDLEDYCESSQVELKLLGDDGYIILTEDEVVDWVGRPNTTFAAIRIIKRHFHKQWFTADLREKTSWPIVKAMEERGKLKIRDHEEWTWGGETMHEVSIKLLI
jgi:hypothetical protein